MKNFFFTLIFLVTALHAQSGNAGKLVDEAKALLDNSKDKEAEKLIIQALNVSEKENDNFNLVRSVKLLGTLYYNYRELEASASFYNSPFHLWRSTTRRREARKRRMNSLI